MSSIQAQTITYKGEPCIELRAGDYLAMIAPGIGSNVIRLRNEAHDIEFSVIMKKPQLKRSSSHRRFTACRHFIFQTVWMAAV